MTVTVQLFRATNSIYVTDGERIAYLDIDKPKAAFEQLVALLTRWTERGLVLPAEETMDPDDIFLAVAAWKRDHPGEINIAEIDFD